jgi:eukaryotic-like serine/threonine-protein kinase
VLWAANRRLLTAQNVAHETVDRSLGALDQIIRPLTGDNGSPVADEARRVLPVAIQYYDKVSLLYSEHEPIQEVAAKAQRQAGYARMILGRPRGFDDYRASIRTYENITARYPRYIWLRVGLIATLQEYAGLLTKPADVVEADASFRRALAVAEGLLDDKDACQPCFRIQLVGPFNSLAWALARRPPARAGDAGLAVRLARKAVEWEPEQFAYWNTLGVAHYRDGNWSAAIDALSRSLELSKGGTAADWFFLACIDQQRGKINEARLWYDRAVTWVQRNPPPDKAQAAELEEFRDETARAIGVAR